MQGLGWGSLGAANVFSVHLRRAAPLGLRGSHCGAGGARTTGHVCILWAVRCDRCWSPPSREPGGSNQGLLGHWSREDRRPCCLRSGRPGFQVRRESHPRLCGEGAVICAHTSLGPKAPQSRFRTVRREAAGGMLQRCQKAGGHQEAGLHLGPSLPREMDVGGLQKSRGS